MEKKCVRKSAAIINNNADTPLKIAHGKYSMRKCINSNNNLLLKKCWNWERVGK